VDKKVIIYISNNNLESRRLMDQLDDWKIYYLTKNISEDKENLRQLQEYGIFSTPATFVGDTAILGFQKKKLKQTLGLDNPSHYRTIL